MAKKKRVVCDTNIIIEILKDNTEVISEIESIGEENIALTPITPAELYFGAFNKKELQIIKQRISSTIILPFDLNSTQVFFKFNG